MALPALGCLSVLFAARHRIFQRNFWKTRTAVVAISLVVFFIAVIGPLAIFHARGGSIHTRYALVIVWIPAGAIALGAFQISKRFVPSLLAAMIVFTTTWIHQVYALSKLDVLAGFSIEKTIQSSALADYAASAFVWMAAMALACCLTIMVIQQRSDE